MEFEEWCERFIIVWNLFPSAHTMTLEECLKNEFVQMIYKTQKVPSVGVESIQYKSPEEAANLAMNYSLSDC